MTNTADRPMTERDFLTAFQAGPHRRVDVGYADVATWSFGPAGAPDLLFVHGWPLWSATFRRIAPLFSNSRLHFLDLPGSGKSTVRDLARVTLRDHADVVAAVVKALGLASYAILAHDSGGAIARAVAARDPGVRALVMGNTEVPKHVPWQVKFFVAAARLGLGGALIAGMRVGFLRRSSLAYGGCFTDPRTVDGEFGRLFVEPLRDAKARAGQMALAKNLDPNELGDLDELHGKIRCPTLLLWGTDDPFFPLARAKKMMPGFAGGAELLEVPGGKLFIHEDAPQAFAPAVSFLSRAMVRAAA
jgi:pimeloyl-ACP methyl ester carboxylesterase